MYSNEDLERFYFKYQTETLPHGQSLQSFCLNNNVPYNLFSNGIGIPVARLCLVRMFMYDKIGSMLFEKKFHIGSSYH